jgi:CheY-like chemotaxis protein
MIDTTVLEGLRVLIVEDEDDMRNLLGAMLESFGAKPILTCSVESGLDALREHLPDIVISDIGMPEQNGYALIASVRKQEHPQLRTTPVIALTAFTTAADRDTALTSGFDAFMTKPAEPDQLADTIRRLHDRRINVAA